MPLKKKYKVSTLFVYLLSTTFIFGWWWIFQPQEDLPIYFSPTEYHVENASYFEPIPRDELKQALAGDFSKMVELIILWDEEAGRLEELKFKHIARLSSEEFREVIHLFKNLNGFQEIKIIPQTHIAATILLAIAPKSILAIPMGLRENGDLFHLARLNQYPLNCQSLEGEVVQYLAPDLAFVTTYSNPTFLKMLRHQEVPEIKTEPVRDLKSLFETIDQIATYAQHPREGRLLSLFMKGSMMAIDNRMHALQQFLGKKVEKVLYLFGEHPYFSPLRDTLIHDLLNRFGIETFSKPFTFEEIELFAPDLLLLASDSKPKIKAKSLYQFNRAVQESPTQFALLAYRDIAAALMDHIIHE
jgi:hypothetical protein